MSLITAAKVQDVEPIWTTLFAKALEGKDVKDMLMNTGGGAAPAAAAAAPAAGGDAPAASGEAAPAAEEKKEEGKLRVGDLTTEDHLADMLNHSQGGVRRGHGLWSLRLSASHAKSVDHGMWHHQGAGHRTLKTGHDMAHGYGCASFSIQAALTAHS